MRRQDKYASLPSAEDDEAAERRRREKKRIQNRNSQKLLREKRTSYVRGLERIVNNLDSGDGSPSEQTSQLLQTVMQLKNENQDFRDQVLRLRKKFLSLSTAAATSAGMLRSASILIEWMLTWSLM